MPFKVPPTRAQALAKLAAEVAIVAPLKRSRHSPRAYIDWQLIERIRAELEAAGWPWREGVKAYRAELARRGSRV